MLYYIHMSNRHHHKFGKEVQENSVYVFANNPRTAKLRAQRWCDAHYHYKPVDYDTKVHECKDLASVSTDDTVIYQYNVKYRLACGLVVSCFSFGCDDDDAMMMSRKYFPVTRSKGPIEGIEIIERVKPNVEDSDGATDST